MSDYRSGKAYREALGNRPHTPSTPESREGKGPHAHLGHLAPITRHANRPQRHVETVGWMDHEYHEHTRPNSDAKTGTDRFYKDTASTKELGTLNRVKMKPRS